MTWLFEVQHESKYKSCWNKLRFGVSVLTMTFKIWYMQWNNSGAKRNMQQGKIGFIFDILDSIKSKNNGKLTLSKQ